MTSDPATNTGSALYQTLQLRVTSDTQIIQYSGWPKGRHAV